MASRNLTVEIAKAVHGLARANQPAWQLLLQALVARADEVTDQMVSAEPAKMANAQGRAQEARELVKLLDEAPKLAQQLEERETSRGQPNVRTHHAAGWQS
jgi:hypothetical protein